MSQIFISDDDIKAVRKTRTSHITFSYAVTACRGGGTTGEGKVGFHCLFGIILGEYT
jgi:hypothetical protein